MSNITRIELPEFKAEKNDFVYGFYGKNGGVSDSFYESLNVSYQSKDDLASIKENRRRIATMLSRDNMEIMTVNQIHSHNCLVVENAYEPSQLAPDADALVTDVPNVPIAVMSADCCPVLFYAQKADGAPIIGAAHAGWCGALKGVIESTVEGIRHLGGELASIKACIGPTIQRKNYEVTADFARPFLEEDPLSERFFSAGKNEDKLQFDLPGYVASRLGRSGIKSVCDSGLDTYSLAEDFFSYRRAQHKTENDYGRQASVIMIK
jgi:YfiH family protein|tara:strand:+ start:376564 stop:377358 length:795 start_codon:yes stop_codon:yes gene_type:complete